MGTGVGGVAHDEAAAQMIKTIQAYRARTLRSVLLVDVDQTMVEAWRKLL
jgi:O-acetyl-ADP-ribose deacetylase (regulator of RNase III)